MSVCNARMYTYAYMLSRWWGGDSGGMEGVKHFCGSKPRSGQLQWPMFKVNGGLRWLFISRLLYPCWIPSANRHQPSSSFSFLLSLSTGTCPENDCVHWDPFFGPCVTPPSACRGAHMLTHCGFVHTSAVEHSQSMMTSELISFWRETF